MMNRRNAMILALGAALMLALPVMASAQMSRVEGMAVQGDFIKDWSGIFTYTSQVANVGNLVYAELGNVSSPPLTFDRSVGAVIGNLWEGRMGTWAIHLREQTPQLGQGDAASNPGAGPNGTDPNINTTESFDLMWGKKVGTKSIGLRVNRSFGRDLETGGGITSKLEYDFSIVGGDPNLSRNILGIGAGGGFELNPTTNVELGVLWQKRTWLDESTFPPPPAGGSAVRSEEDGGNAYLLAARAMWQWQPNIMVVPVFKYYNFDLGEKLTFTPAPAPPATQPAPIKNSRKGWQVGVAGNWTLGSNDLFVLGINFAQNKLEQEENLFGLVLPPNAAFNDTVKVTETIMPQLFASLETHVNSWLTLRFGATKGAVQKVKFEGTPQVPGVFPTEIEQNLSSFDMRLGAGVKVGNLQLDAILANEFPNNLPYFISGNSTPGMFTKVTATYPF